jgi:hypothetical protein
MNHLHAFVSFGKLVVCFFPTKWSLGLYDETGGVKVLDLGPFQFTVFS